MVAPMPVDIELFSPSNTQRNGVLFVGKLDAQNGARILLEALALLPNTVNGTFIGDGPDAQALHARAAALGVAGRVRWCGALPHEALAAHYRAARVVVAPATEAEGLGLVAAEALLCETPVVASHIGGLSDLVEDGVTGRLVPPADAKALAAALTESLAAPARLAEWGSAGRARILARMSPAACAARYREIYDEVIRTRAA
jgi:glycosyltransferase involved in cell wall biosynthesis